MTETGRDDQGAVTGGRIRRAAPLVGLVARTAGEEVLDRLRHRAGRSAEPNERDSHAADRYARNAERYVELMGRSKGVLMKAGQMMSFMSLSGTVPEDQRRLFQEALGRLQADAPPMAPELAAEVIHEELGQTPDRIFAEFDPEPLAAASIGQVHRAVTNDGREVAVKVQYPGVDQAIRDDLKNSELLATFFSLLKAIVPGLAQVDFRAMAEEVTTRMTEELDYLHEADNQRFFADSYRAHPYIHVPEIVGELTTRRVLTQEFVEGMCWSEAVKTDDQELKDTWGEAIWRFSLGSLRRIRAFNADPHPGNYLFHPDGKVTFVDFGCVRFFTEQWLHRLQALVRAMIDKDAERLRQLWIEAGAIGADGPNAQELYAWWAESMDMVTAAQPYTITTEQVADGLRRFYSPVGPSASVVRSIACPPEFVFLSRIDTGLMSVLGELHATNDWVSLTKELDGLAGPATPMGEADQKWRESR